MAKAKGLLKITGKLGNLVFYELNGKLVVRERYGPSLETQDANPKFRAFQHQSSEFSQVSRASKLLRDGFRSLAHGVADTTYHSRMNEVLNRVKNLDVIHEKGQRTVQAGLETPEGRALLSGFECNRYASLPSEIRKAAKLASSTGQFHLSAFDFNPAEKWLPEVYLQWLKVDFEHQTCHYAGSILTPSIEGAYVQTQPKKSTLASGILFIVVRIRTVNVDGTYSRDRRRQSLTIL